MCGSASLVYAGAMTTPAPARAAGLLLAGLLALASAASAGEADHDRARRAVEAGEIKPLREIAAEAEKTHGGQLIEAELESERGRMIYELKLLTREGRVVKLLYDARTGSPLPDRESGRR